MRAQRRERLTRLLAEIGFTAPAEHGWRERAACLGSDPEVFYPLDHRHGAAQARLICAGCPVRELCLAEVMSSEDPALRWGVVGGLTPAERSGLFDQQRRDVA
jgi:WhiB family redox-sensing transcriptional regulator